MMSRKTARVIGAVVVSALCYAPALAAPSAQDKLRGELVEFFAAE